MTIAIASQTLLCFWWWIGLPALLAGMLLTLGLRRRGTVAVLIGVLGFMGLASFGSGITLDGLASGEVFSLSRAGPLMVSRVGDPTYFWISFGLWNAGCAATLAGCCWLVIRLWQRRRSSKAFVPGESD